MTRMRRGRTRLFPSFNLILEIFVEAPNTPGQVMDAELRAGTGEFGSAALGMKAAAEVYVACTTVRMGASGLEG